MAARGYNLWARTQLWPRIPKEMRGFAASFQVITIGRLSVDRRGTTQPGHSAPTGLINAGADPSVYAFPSISASTHNSSHCADGRRYLGYRSLIRHAKRDRESRCYGWPVVSPYNSTTALSGKASRDSALMPTSSLPVAAARRASGCAGGGAD